MKVVKQYSQAWDSYELIDAGGGKKIERFGNLTLIRPELQAYFKSEIPFTKWDEMADWEFVEDHKKKGYWKNLQAKEDLPTTWEIGYGGLKLKLELTKLKHVGLFSAKTSRKEINS